MALLLLLLSVSVGVVAEQGNLPAALLDEEFLLGGVGGLHQLTPLLTATFRGAAFFAHIATAELHVQAGRLADAGDSYSYVLANYALDDLAAAPVHLALGNVLSNMSRPAEAEASYLQAGTSRKYAHLAYYSLGLLHTRTGRTEDAVQALETALFFRPAFFAAMHALGSLHIIRGHVEKGLRLYDASLQLLQDSGVLPPEEEGTQGQAATKGTTDLESHLVRHVLHVFAVPTDASTGSSLGGTVTSSTVALAESLRAFLTRLGSLDLAAFHRGLGLKLADTGALEDGLAHLRRAVSLSPSEFGYLALWTALAQPLAYRDGAEVWSTRAALVTTVRQAVEDRVTVVHPEHLYELYQLHYQLPFSGLPAGLLMRDIALLFASSEAPVLPFVAPRLWTSYPRALAAAAAAEAGGPSVPRSPFALPRSERTEQVSASRKGAIVRVGLLSYQMHDCPVGHLFLRLAKHLRGYTAAVKRLRADKAASKAFDIFRTYPRRPSAGGGTLPDVHCPPGASAVSCVDPLLAFGYLTIPGVAGFNVTLVRLSRQGDNVTRALSVAVDTAVYAGGRPFEFESTRSALVAANLDVLVAADPGIQPEMYALLFGRVAPVQAALWGSGPMAHTLTTGLADSVDYYIVGDSGASQDMQTHMSEQTVRLGDVGLYFPRLRPVTLTERFAASRRHGLLEGRHLFLVPATLNALHPAFDDVLLGVLAADPEAEALCLYEQGQELWLSATRERLAAHPVGVAGGHALVQRVRFTRDFLYIDNREKFALMAGAEAILDPFPVGLGVTAMEALAVGTPVLTLPSRQPLRPFAAGLLSRLNLTAELVATSVEDYVAKALRLGVDAAHRRTLRARIAARRSLLEWDMGKGEGEGGSDAEEAAASRAWVQANTDAGYGKPEAGAMHDWLSFLGRTGRPWAVDRVAAAAPEERLASRRTTIEGAA
jgi:tetratricopeptide (TPR) repeat protein